MAVGVELGEGEQEGEEAGRKAAHGEHEAEPAAVSVRPLMADAAEDGQGKHGRGHSGEEDGGAGGEELAGVGAHKGSG